jgi:hypothetical protein
MTDPTPPRKEAELVELVRSIDVRAPESLHRYVEALVAERSAGARGSTRRALTSSRPRLAAIGVLAAVAIAALVVGLTSGGSSSLTLRQASALTVAPATSAAPQESPRNAAQLTAAVEGVAFPYWEDRFGLRSTGARTDHLGGRTIQTVYYADGDQRIGYAIVAGARPPAMGAGTTVFRDGRAFILFSVEGRPVITWHRDGRLCVVSGRGVNSATLLRLASSTTHEAPSAPSVDGATSVTGFY